MRRRSASERAGSPSKSRITQSSLGPERLAEVVVAVRADHHARGAGVREQAQLLAHLLAAAGDRLEPLVVVRAGRGRRARSPRRPSPSAARAPRRLGVSGANAGSVESDASTVCISPVTSPSRRSRSRNALGALADLVERELPAVDARRARTAGGCRASRSSGPPEYAYQPPSGAMFAKPCSVRKRSISSSGLMPGLEPAERLEDQLVVEDDRRVRLLGPDRAHVEQLAAETGEALDGANSTSPSAPCSVKPDASRCTSSRASCGSLERRRSRARPPRTA